MMQISDRLIESIKNTDLAMDRIQAVLEQELDYSYQNRAEEILKNLGFEITQSDSDPLRKLTGDELGSLELAMSYMWDKDKKQGSLVRDSYRVAMRDLHIRALKILRGD